MTPGQRHVHRTLVLAAALAALAISAGCYNPKIPEGSFLCGPASSCPDGFSCKNARCYKGAEPSDASGGNDGNSCQRQVLQCSASSGSEGACDPVCQSGCPCGQKCVNTGTGNRCAATAPPVREHYETCQVDNDRCRPGSICLPELAERCGAHCYRFCRTDEDCGGVGRCTGEAQDGAGTLLYKICSAKLEVPGCNPTGANPACGPSAGADRRPPAFGCYLLSYQHPEETVCECAGTLPEGAACEREYECVPGNECLKIGMEARCRKLCTLPTGGVVPPVLCNLGQTCTAFQGGTRYGFCM